MRNVAAGAPRAIGSIVVQLAGHRGKEIGSVNVVRLSEHASLEAMNIDEIARKLVAYCREATWEDAQRTLYADDAPDGRHNER